MTQKTLPELTIGLGSYAANDPGGWGHMFALARGADAAGIDRVMASDHVVYGEQLEEYAKPETGGRKGGTQPTGPDGHWLCPLTALTFVAGMTTRLRLRTQILLAALRRPVTLAKATSTLDVLSAGRFDMGVGVGWQREEYEAAGLKFDGRGRLLDHTLEVCQTLWRNRVANYMSLELCFEKIHQMPKPTRPDGVPIWVSGTIRNTTVSRIVRFGAVGWIPWGDDDTNLLESIPRMKDAIVKAGGNVDNLQVVGTLPVVNSLDGSIDLGRTMEGVPDFVNAGVTDFVARVAVPKTSDADIVEGKLRPLVGAFRAATGRPAP